MTRAYAPPPARSWISEALATAGELPSGGLFFAALIFCLTVWGASL